jgi:hypothetical protein
MLPHRNGQAPELSCDSTWRLQAGVCKRWITIMGLTQCDTLPRITFRHLNLPSSVNVAVVEDL